MKNLKTGLLILFTVCILSACEKDSEELPPLLKAEVAKITDCMCLPYLARYSFRGETVYFRGYRGPGCNWFPTYYNKDGVKIEVQIGSRIPNFDTEATLIGTVWECK